MKALTRRESEQMFMIRSPTAAMQFAAKENKEKLRIQFRKSIQRGYAKNAELDPVVPAPITNAFEPEETCIVRVDSTKEGKHYWFTDRRVLCQHDDSISELLRYQSVTEAHWMFKDLFTYREKLRDP